MFDPYRKQVLQDFDTFLRFKSISAEPEFKADVRACCNWVRDYLKKGGLETEIIETPSHPALFAKWEEAGADKPTVLFYGHYDVQPVDPLSEWETPPFEPTRRGTEIYARGAVDDKGQILYTMAAVVTALKEKGSLPVNVKFIIEGEEEYESRGLREVLPKITTKLKADFLLIPDSGIPDKETPAITLGCRGLVTMTLTVTGSAIDLHSGASGGIVYNPLHALVEILGAARDQNGRVTIPGFYDDVAELTSQERQQLFLEAGDSFYKNQLKAEMTGGEKGFPPGESGTVRPTLEINGIGGGYSGSGFKTVIPAKAVAKVSCRLVPNQDHQKIADQVVAFFKAKCPKGVKLEISGVGGCQAFRTSPDTPGTVALAKAYAEVFGKECKFICTGGSVPITPELAAAAEAPVALMGLGLLDDAVHAPNEHFGVDRFERGFIIIRRFLELMGGNR